MTTRAEAEALMPDVMREFMARAVLFHDAVARSGGLNGTDMQVVGLLMSGGPATPGDLAARTGISAGGAITAVVDRLERGGFVRRDRDPDDRRRVLLSALPERIMESVGPIYQRVGQRWSEYLATLTDDQVVFAVALLTTAAEINRDEIDRLRAGGR